MCWKFELPSAPNDVNNDRLEMFMNKKNNRQFQSSDVRMKQVMLELLNTTPFDKITVSLICSRAGVNRSTFYAHYTDIYDMLGQMERNLQKKLMEHYPASEHVVPLSLESFLPFLEFIREHRDFYRIALKTRQDFPLRQGFEPLWEQVVRPLSLKAGITSESEMMYYLIGFQAGFTMILKYWLEHECREPINTMAQIIQNIIPSIWKSG